MPIATFHYTAPQTSPVRAHSATNKRPAASAQYVQKAADRVLGANTNRSLHRVVPKGTEAHISITGTSDPKQGSSSVVLSDPTCNMNVHIDPQGNVTARHGMETVTFNRTHIPDNVNSRVGRNVRVDESEGGWGACSVAVDTKRDGTTTAHIQIGAPASSGEPSQVDYMRAADRPLVGPAYGR